MNEPKVYRLDTGRDGQWYVVSGSGERVAGPFPHRDEALADARDRASNADGPALVEGENVAVQEQYGGPSRR